MMMPKAPPAQAPRYSEGEKMPPPKREARVIDVAMIFASNRESNRVRLRFCFNALSVVS